MGKPARVKNLRLVDPGDNHGGAPTPIPTQVAETLYREFEALGLTPYQARVVVALQQAGSSSCVDLARLSGIPRTSVYQVLDELDSRGLASRLPGNGPALWGSIGRKAVLARLIDLEAERLDNLKNRAERVGEILDQLLPSDRSVSLPYVQVIHDPSRVGPLYKHLLGRTTEELLVFNRPPYTKAIGRPERAVVDAARRVDARALYQAAQAEDGEYQGWHHEMEAYHAAGVQGRVVEDLPIKLAIFDRQSTLLSLDDPVLPNVGFPMTLLIEHPGYSSVQAKAFENLWEAATPYEEVHAQFEAHQSNLA